jgi:hypothetical protein
VTIQLSQNFITIVIEHYGLELDDDRVDAMMVSWFEQFDPTWIVKAIVESLYRGRYKVKSVDNILKDWQRLGKPRYNFPPDYEREILHNLPVVIDLADTPSPLTILSPQVDRVDLEPPTLSPPEIDTADLNPEESPPFQHHLQPLVSFNSSSSVVSATEEINSIPLADCVAIDSQLTVATSDRSTLPSPSFLAPSNCHSQIEPNRIPSTPVTLHLFKTLKAIVAPNQRNCTGNQHPGTIDREQLMDKGTN